MSFSNIKPEDYCNVEFWRSRLQMLREVQIAWKSYTRGSPIDFEFWLEAQLNEAVQRLKALCGVPNEDPRANPGCRS